jgi:hypothetical protein
MKIKKSTSEAFCLEEGYCVPALCKMYKYTCADKKIKIIEVSNKLVQHVLVTDHKLQTAFLHSKKDQP